jgi:putative transposase
VIITAKLRLYPDDQQAAQLSETIRQMNLAANYAAQMAFSEKVYSLRDIHRLCYYELRSRFGLKAEQAIRAIGKVVAAFAIDRTKCPDFSVTGSINLDAHLYRINDSQARITTLVGRTGIPFACPDCHKHLLSRRMGEAQLVHRDGQFYLHVTVEVEPEPAITPTGCIGVDLGIVQIATTSEGEQFSGEQTKRHRRKCQQAIRTYQKRNTRNAKRRLKKLSKRESRFQKNENHRIAKQIVARAKALQFGIAIENLTGIRQRLLEQPVNRLLKIQLGNWAFAHLRFCIEYKARLAGVPVVVVDPRNTSRTCSQCGYCDKANRTSQSKFSCHACFYTTNADYNAACNIGRIGASTVCPHSTPVLRPLNTRLGVSRVQTSLLDFIG